MKLQAMYAVAAVLAVILLADCDIDDGTGRPCLADDNCAGDLICAGEFWQAGMQSSRWQEW